MTSEMSSSGTSIITSIEEDHESKMETVPLLPFL